MSHIRRQLLRNFHQDYESLSRNDVFNTSQKSRKPKKGDITSIAVSALPIIKREVKKRLSSKELVSLQDFELETYIMELALVNFTHYKDMPKEDFVQGIVRNIKTLPKFWIQDSLIYQRITGKSSDAGDAVEETPVTEPVEAPTIVQKPEVDYRDLKSAIFRTNEVSLFAANRFMRIPRLPFVLQKVIYNYVKSKLLYDRMDSMKPDVIKVYKFYLQNLVFFAQLRAKHHNKIELSAREHLNDQKNIKFRRKYRRQELLERNDSVSSVTSESNEQPSSMFRGIRDPADQEVLLEFNEFCDAQNITLGKFWDRFHDMRLREQTLLLQSLRFILTSFENFVNAPGNVYERVLHMVPPINLDSSSAFFFYDLTEPQTYDPDLTVDEGDIHHLLVYIRNQKQKPGYFQQRMYYRTHSITKVAKINTEFYDSERHRRDYVYYNPDRRTWTEEEYSKFLEGVEKFKDEPLANRKIASYMGSHIDSNHVRYEKQALRKRQDKLRKQKAAEEKAQEQEKAMAPITDS